MGRAGEVAPHGLRLTRGPALAPQRTNGGAGAGSALYARRLVSPQPRIGTFIRWIAHACAIVVMACAVAAARANDVSERRAAMQRLADHWREAQLPDGSLPYGYDFLPDGPAEPDHSPWYYVVRQAGSLYMLVEYYRISGDARLREASRRAIEALKAHSLPIGKSTLQRGVEATRIESLPFARWRLQGMLDRMGLLYEPNGPDLVVSATRRYDQAHAGATAMALVALLAYERATGDSSFVELRGAWLRGLLDLRQPGGGFRALPTTIETSDFYDGEAWFALAVYADLHREDTALARELAAIDDVMMTRYGPAPTPGFHHWGSMAAAQRYGTTGDRRFVDFLRSQTENYFEHHAKKLDPAENNCPEVEGFASALAALDKAGERDTPLARRTREWLAREARTVLRLQIAPGQTGLRFDGSARLDAPRMADFAGTFLLGLYDPRTRVDMDMHCLSALAIIEREGVLQRSPE